MDLKAMTEEQLVAANLDLGRDVDTLQAKRVEINAELRRRDSLRQVRAAAAAGDATAMGALIEISTKAKAAAEGEDR